MSEERTTAVSWRIKPMPTAYKELALDGRYTAAEMAQISRGYRPQEQQDKWFIYFADEWLHVHRSWTGTCIFQLRLLPDEAQYHADRLRVNADPAQYTMADDAYNVSLLAYLIDHLLLNRFAPMPLPGKMSTADEQRHTQHVMGERQERGIRLSVL